LRHDRSCAGRDATGGMDLESDATLESAKEAAVPPPPGEGCGRRDDGHFSSV